MIRDELDHRSSRLSRTAEEENIGNAWKSKSKPILTSSSKQNYFRENSEISQSNDEGHVLMTNSHDKGLIEVVEAFLKSFNFFQAGYRSFPCFVKKLALMYGSCMKIFPASSIRVSITKTCHTQLIL